MCSSVGNPELALPAGESFMSLHHRQPCLGSLFGGAVDLVARGNPKAALPPGICEAKPSYGDYGAEMTVRYAMMDICDASICRRSTARAVNGSTPSSTR